MGREVKRVPNDFDWPLNEPWPGYCIETPDCGFDETCPEARGSLADWDVGNLCEFHQALWDAKSYPAIPVPEGEGWQLWETVSEGSPISPVFETREELVVWLTTEYKTVTGYTLTLEQAEAFVSSGWAPSLVFTPYTGVVSGESFVGGL